MEKGGRMAADSIDSLSTRMKKFKTLYAGQKQGELPMPISSAMGAVRNCSSRLKDRIANSQRPSISMFQSLVLAAAVASLVFPTFTPLSAQPDAPKVVSVFPADGAVNVASETTIKIRFDQSMSCDRLILRWDSDLENTAGFRLRGEVSYDDVHNEFTIPVFLEPGKKHCLRFNKRENPVFERDPSNEAGFLSKNRIPAEEFSWSFGTIEAPSGNDGPVPNVISVKPTPDTEVALFTTLEVKFDHPMNPCAFGLGPRTGSSRDSVQLAGEILYDKEKCAFSVPLIFPPNWNGDITIAGFRSERNVEAAAKTINYRTLQKPLSDEQSKALAQAGSSVELIRLLERILQRYESIRSIKVEAEWTYTSRGKVWATYLDFTRSVFARDGEKYFGDISMIKGSADPFMIGSDGKQCWFRRSDKLTVGPRDQMAIQQVSIATPFHGISGRTVQQIANEEKLEYLGVQTVGDRSFHQIRGWANVNLDSSRIWVSEPIIWYFDTDTLLLSKVRQQGEIKFVYQSLDMPLPESLFAAPESNAQTVHELEPLEEGYDKRYLEISDGSNGRMILLWGQKGPKGSFSSN